MNIAPETRPLLSIIVPVYKVKAYLAECVTSLCQQSYEHIEIILVDDGCPEGCGEMCEAFAKEDARIIVLHQTNQGQAAARNAALEIAHGDYISFVDSDDYISPDYYVSHITYLEWHPEVDISIAGIQNVNEEGVPLALSPFQPRTERLSLVGVEAVSDYLLQIHFAQGIYRAAVWASIRFPLGIILEDCYVIPEICQHTRAISASYVGTYYYRQRGGATMSAFTERHLACFRIVTEHHLAYFAQTNRRLYYHRLAVAYIYSWRHRKLLTHMELRDYRSELAQHPIQLKELLTIRGLKHTLRLRLLLIYFRRHL